MVNFMFIDLIQVMNESMLYEITASSFTLQDSVALSLWASLRDDIEVVMCVFEDKKVLVKAKPAALKALKAHFQWAVDADPALYNPLNLTLSLRDSSDVIAH